MSDMAQKNSSEWKWYVGYDDERFQSSYDTREEAVRAAQAQGGGYICEALPPQDLRLSAYFIAGEFGELAEERAQEDHGDPENESVIFDVSVGVSELQTMVRATIDAWQDKHGLRFHGTQLADVRGTEFIPAQEPKP